MSDTGKANISDNAIVLEGACVRVTWESIPPSGDGITIPLIPNIMGRSLVGGNAHVEGKVFLFDRVRVTGSARVVGSWAHPATLFSDVRVDGNACVGPGVLLHQSVQVYGSAEVSHAIVRGTIRIGGTARILGGAWDGDMAITSGVWYSPEDWGTNALL